MKKNIINLVLVFLTSIFFLNSCNKNPCESIRDGKNFTLSDSIKTYISNYQNANKIIFTTNSGNEVSFDISEFQDFNREYEYSGMCIDDTTMNQTIKGNYQIIQLSLSNKTEISESIYITLLEIPLPPNDNNVKEGLLVTLGELLSNSFESDDELLGFYLNSNYKNVIFHDSLEVGNKLYYSVYESNYLNSLPKFEIKYAKHKGIVYMLNRESGKEYFYKRKK